MQICYLNDCITFCFPYIDCLQNVKFVTFDFLLGFSSNCNILNVLGQLFFLKNSHSLPVIINSKVF